nr:helix-turn-helix transcriptional regulator [Parafrankia discariae]
MFVIPTEHPLSHPESTSEPSHPLRRLRALHGWSYEAVARIVAVRARELGVASMAAQRQKIWRWENRGVIPDRISQLALARELGVPDGEVTAHPWPEWLPELGAPNCAQQIATLRGILERVRDVLRAGDSATASALVEQGLTVPVDEMVLGTAQIRGAAVRTAMVRGARRGGPAEHSRHERFPDGPAPQDRFPAGHSARPGPARRPVNRGPAGSADQLIS